MNVLLEPGTAGVLRTTDGGARQPEADLWCSYAAVRTLMWLGHRPADPDAVAEFLLSRRNADGGFAWQRRLQSDIWATYYCTQALADLGRPLADADGLAEWLPALRTDAGGFAMTKGQSADVWATYYAARTYAEILRSPVPKLERLAAWLAETQTRDGGLTWAPGSRRADVRACYYGALAWRAAARDRQAPWRAADLERWLRDQQGSDGGFAFAPGGASCAWAAFRATRALEVIGSRPREPVALRTWLEQRWLPGSGYERWAGYGRTDVWACFSTVGALASLGERPEPDRQAAMASVIRACQLPGSGFTYRDPDAAGDSLATAAALVLHTLRGNGDANERDALATWLRDAQLPFEDGVMYMPGRGAEIRCTLWAAAAVATTGLALDTGRLSSWLRNLQNADGGFGYWQGRGSDLVSTASALETAMIAGLPLRATLDAGAALGFIDACRKDAGYASNPGAAATPAATAQAARALKILGRHDDAFAAGNALERWASPLGGISSTPRGLPDLLATYQVVLTRQVLGLRVDRVGLGRFVTKVRKAGGFTWSPLGATPAGPLADCLGTQLDAVAAGFPIALLRLNL